MLCDICGAFTHLQSKCPHNPNNKTYLTENWDNDYDNMDEIRTGQYHENVEETSS